MAIEAPTLESLSGIQISPGRSGPSPKKARKVRAIALSTARKVWAASPAPKLQSLKEVSAQLDLLRSELGEKVEANAFTAAPKPEEQQGTNIAATSLYSPSRATMAMIPPHIGIA